MNYADSARISTVLENIWWEKVRSIKQADVVIFDTCSVKQKAEDKISGKISTIPKEKKIWLTWCMVSHHFKFADNKKQIWYKSESQFKRWNFAGIYDNIDLKKIPLIINQAFNPLWHTYKKKLPNLELLFRIDDINLLPQILKYIWYNIKQTNNQNPDYLSIYPTVSNQTDKDTFKSTFVPIAIWCNQFCSYCIVPFARWLERYRSVDDIVQEIQYWVKKGKKEIILLWQIVNKHPQFEDILKQILKIKSIKWLRYTSPYPTYFSQEILTLHENEESLAPHIHAPIQSWSDKILKAMHRWYTCKQYKQFIDNVRKLKRDISITTDIIVWFPDESSKDFEQSIEIIKYWQFDMIYTWMYSSRPWTFADKNFKDNISQIEKRKRRQIINDTLYPISLKNNKKEEWKIKQVIINKKEKDKYTWYTDNMKNVRLPGNKQVTIWDIINVKIIKWEILNLKANLFTKN